MVGCGVVGDGVVGDSDGGLVGTGPVPKSNPFNDKWIMSILDPNTFHSKTIIPIFVISFAVIPYNIVPNPFCVSSMLSHINVMLVGWFTFSPVYS